MRTVEIDGRSLTLEHFDAVVSRTALAGLTEEAKRKKRSLGRATVELPSMKVKPSTV